MLGLRALFTTLLGVFLMVACTSLPVPKVDKEVALEEAQNCWKDILEKYVDSEGRVDFYAVSKNRSCLERFVNFISKVGPQTDPAKFPTAEDKLAFYINSYNALSMYNIVDRDIPRSLSGFQKIKFFFLRKMFIGGEKMSLYSYENNIIRKLGEERVHFALNCMSVGCPVLPKVPFEGKTLLTVLEHQAKYFFSERRNLFVDDSQKKVHISEILRFYTEDFLKKKPSLIEYINQYVDKKIPTDYEVEFFPYDWTVNAQPKSAT